MDSVLIVGAMIGTLLLGSPSPEPVDQILYYSSNMMSIVDWSQTRYIAENPDKYWEVNPLLGKHPSRARVDNYFMSWWIVNQFVARVMPEDFARVYLAGNLMLELTLVDYNVGVGVKCDF